VVRAPDEEFLAGDLEEDYLRVREASGERAARRWYRRQVLGTARAWLVRSVSRSGGRERGAELFADAGRDVRHGARSLIRAPGFTVATVLTLGLGLGGAATVVALAESLLRPLPFPESRRLVVVREVRAGSRSSVAPANYLDWRREAGSFEGLAAHDTRSASITVGGVASRERTAVVSGNFFEVLGVRPSLGRTFHPDFDPAFSGRVAVLGQALWRDAFAGDPAAVGSTFQVDDLSYEVVGVAPPGFVFADPTVALWLRSPTEAPDIRSFRGDLTQMRDAWYFDVVGRLQEDIDVGAARSEMAAIAGRLAERFPDTNGDSGVEITPLLEDTVAGFRSTLLALVLAVALVLLTASVNVAHLGLARSAERERSTTVRMALGAGPGVILRHLLAEGWILGAAGALLGLALAVLGSSATVSGMGGTLPRAGEVTVRSPTVASVLLLGLGAGTLIALTTYLRTRRGQAMGALRSRSGGRGRVRRVLVAAQVAAAVTLLTGAGLLGRSLQRLAAVDLGFATEGLVTMRIALPDARLRPYPERIAVYEGLVERLASLPGVGTIGFGAEDPVSMGPRAGLVLLDRPDWEDQPDPGWQPVSDHYFAAVGMRLLGGRGFDRGDGPEAPDVGIVNEALAEAAYPGESALGKRVTIGLDGHDRPITIVGIVADTRTRGPASEPGPVLYRPIAQTNGFYSADAAFMAARLEGGGTTAGAIRQALRDAAPNLPVFALARGEDLALPFTRGRAAILAVLGVFAVTALLLGAVGVYGVTAYAVRERRRELGVRLALGADGRRLRREVLGRGLLRAAAGVPVGLFLVVLLARPLQGLLFEVGPADPLIAASATVVVLTITAAALYVPARLAARTDPAEVMRSE
jgi:putative ABC transport system permease protein